MLNKECPYESKLSSFASFLNLDPPPAKKLRNNIYVCHTVIIFEELQNMWRILNGVKHSAVVPCSRMLTDRAGNYVPF